MNILTNETTDNMPLTIGNAPQTMKPPKAKNRTSGMKQYANNHLLTNQLPPPAYLTKVVGGQDTKPKRNVIKTSQSNQEYIQRIKNNPLIQTDNYKPILKEKRLQIGASSVDEPMKES